MSLVTDSVGIGTFILGIPLSYLAVDQWQGKRKAKKEADHLAEKERADKKLKEEVEAILQHSQYQTQQLIPKNGRTVAMGVDEIADLLHSHVEDPDAHPNRRPPPHPRAN